MIEIKIQITDKIRITNIGYSSMDALNEKHSMKLLKQLEQTIQQIEVENEI